MAIAFVAARHGTNVTTAEPTGTAEGDIVLALYTTETTNAAPTPATGFSLVGSFDTNVAASGVQNFGVYWARRGGSAIATDWSSGVSGEVVSLITYRGCIDTGNPVEASNYGEEADNSMVNTGVTTVSPNAMIVGFSSGWTWGAHTSTMANERVDAGETQGIYDNGIQAAVGATGSFTFTVGNVIGTMVLALSPPPLVDLISKNMYLKQGFQ